MSSPKTRRETLRARIRGTLARASLGRPLLLAVVCLASAFLLVDYVSVPKEAFVTGDVAPYDLRSPVSFSYVDGDLTAAQQQEAERSVPQVFDLDVTLGGRLQDRVSIAFDAARRKVAEARESARREGRDRVGREALATITREFADTLDLSIDDDHLRTLQDLGFDTDTETLAREFIGVVMRRSIIADRALLPGDARTISVIRLVGDARLESQLDDFDTVVTVEQARQDLALYVLEHEEPASGAPALRAAGAIARAAVRPNFSYNQLLTEERRQRARASVPSVVIQVKEGTNLFRAGDVLTTRHVEMLAAMGGSHSGVGRAGLLLSMLALCTLVVSTFYLFGAHYVPRFARGMRPLQVMAFLLVLVLGLARLAVEVGTSVFTANGGGPLPGSVMYLVPVAGAVMLVRILANSETAVLFSLAAAVLAALLGDQGLHLALFYLLSGLAGAGGVAHTRERIQVLRAGLQTAMVNLAVVLLIDLVLAHQGPVVDDGAARYLWDGLFAVVGGAVSAVLVLGLVPFFELFGFVTDYKLVELANLNHPLLRQLMLRAPGTYHHSVIVGSLSEAAAEAIGADPLQVRVASYFHDIGKVQKPHYYVENQRDIPNPHDRLTPLQSATLIVRHVVAGARIARDHRLPKMIADNILMHHGTGLMTFFYEKARREAGPDQVVDEAPFRYPGPRPDTREAGILHLADKVEAACRSIRKPTPEKVREMVQRIVSGALNDGQLEDCPLTLKELYTIAGSFADVLMGIYHHRIEYPEPVESGAGKASVITLEFLNPLADGDVLARTPEPGTVPPPATLEAVDEDEEAMSGEFQEMADPPDLTEER